MVNSSSNEGDFPGRALSSSASALVHRFGYPLLSLVRRDFRTRCAPTFLGLGWTVLQPLFFVLLYTFVFLVILKVDFGVGERKGSFVLYLVCGYLPFMAIAEGVTRGATSLTENRSLLDKVIFPAEVLPAVGVITATVTEVIGLVLLIVLAVFFGLTPSPWLLLLPILVLFRVIATLGLSWLVSILNVFVSDLGQFLGLLLTAWMFLTPIFYPAEAVPALVTLFSKLTPLYHVVAAYRAVVLENRFPLLEFSLLTLQSVALAALGLWFFSRTVERAKDIM